MAEAMAKGPEEWKAEGLRLFREKSYGEARKAFETAVTAYQRQDDPLGEAEMLNNLGVIHRLQKDREAAAEALQRAAALFREAGDVNRQAQALGNLGDLYAAERSTREQAAVYYQDAAERFAQSGDPARQSQVLRALSLMRLRQGRWMGAMMRMEESLAVKPRRGPFDFFLLGLLRFALGLFGAG